MASEWNNRPEEQQNEADERYSFVQETIKEEQTDGRKSLRKGFRVIFYGFLLGAAFCFGIACMRPVADNIRNSSSGEFSLTDDEESASLLNYEEVKAQVIEEMQNELSESEETSSIDLNADNYKELYERLAEVRKEAEASLTTVRGYLNKDDENDSLESYGCVLAKSRNQVLVLTCSDNLSGMKRIDVEFYGGQVITASIQKSYDILNMAVLAVNAKDMSKTTERMVQTANLGTSAGLEAGTPVLALGNIYGFSDSVGYGMIQDVSGTIQREDGIYYRIKTDIQGKSTGSGILLNLQGDVIGIVSSVSADEDEMVAAIGISSLKNILELLVNGEDVPYTGITGTDITDEAAEEQNLPTGVYVQNISADSPAMEAGIKNGDIITAVGGKTVTSMEEYQRRLLESTPDSVISVEGKRRSSEGYADIEYKVDLHR